MLKPPIIWILCLCQDWFLNTGALWPNCKRYWRIIFFFTWILHVEKKLCFNLCTLYTLKKFIKISLEKKIAKVCLFYLLWRQFLALLIKMKIKQCLLDFKFKNFCMCSLYSLNTSVLFYYFFSENWIWRFGHTKLTFKFMNSWMWSL